MIFFITLSKYYVLSSYEMKCKTRWNFQQLVNLYAYFDNLIIIVNVFSLKKLDWYILK